ncbi:GID complex subunit 4, VID24 [Gryganskiella cystojenkinii]|nr:GID complex subunit 4, VID24 [Gryganskiella cystojenkinii]
MPVHKLNEGNSDSNSTIIGLSDLRTEAEALQRLCSCPPLPEGDDIDGQEALAMDIEPAESSLSNERPQYTHEHARSATLALSIQPITQERMKEEEGREHAPTALLEFFLNRDREHRPDCPCHPTSPTMIKFSRRVKESFITMDVLPPAQSEEQQEPRQHLKQVSTKLSGPSDPFSPMRMPSTRTGHLYPGSQFRGKQKSHSNSYDVRVDIKHVDLNESFLCGYLHIQGLTEEYPELTTYFEAEMIGPKHSFLTRKWDADECIDEEHWTLFEPFERIANSVFAGHTEGEEDISEEDREAEDDEESDEDEYYDTEGNDEGDRGSETDAEVCELDDTGYHQSMFSRVVEADEDFQCPHHPPELSLPSYLQNRRRRHYQSHHEQHHLHQRKRRRHLNYDPAYSDFRSEDVVFMRWKEHFLVPDHKVQGISGASFAGFYYICYNKPTGQISGYYFHQASEKFQQLSLNHVEERSFASFEFR